MVLIREITNDKKLLEQRLMNQLKGMMFKSFTHEIKTPLNSVLTQLSLASTTLKQMPKSEGGERVK